MAKAKVESQDHGNNDQGHGKATAKDHITFKDQKAYIYVIKYYNSREPHVRSSFSKPSR